MWVRDIELNHVKCIEQLSIDLGTDEKCYKWVTLLGDNGTGKTTILQALGLTLSGENPIGLVDFDEALGNKKQWEHPKYNLEKKGIFHVRTHIKKDRENIVNFEAIKGDSDLYLLVNLVRYHQNILRSSLYHSSTTAKGLSHLDEIILPNSYFAAGYGAFRHISKKPTLSTPKLIEPNKRNNFLTLFQETESLGGFHQWLITLDYERLKNGLTEKEEQHYQLAIAALNELLPNGSTFHSVDPKGIWYLVNGQKVSASYLSDGFRSIIALVGDLIWRLIHTYPQSDNPLLETGVVLIDELAIHLHPKWQRQIAGDLQRTFPNLQFIVTTHSPLIAAGAGKEAITYQLELDEKGKTQIEEIKNIHAWSVDKILQSAAFDLDSPFSKETAAIIKEYYQLMGIQERTTQQETRLEEIRPVVKQAIGQQANEQSAIEKKLDDYIAKHWK